MTITTRCRRSAALGLILALAAGLALTMFPAVKANDTTPAFPFSQDWSNTSLITASNDWSGVTGIQGYLGSGLTAVPGVDPQTVTAGSPASLDVMANQRAPATLTAGGVAEFELPNPVVALQGSGTASAPYLIINLNTTGRIQIAISYTLRDIDGSADDAVQPVALQFRVGNTGDFTNIPEAYVPDATSGPNLAGKETKVWANLPVEAEGQSLVQVRIITTNAVGSDEWVGIDNILITYNYTVGPFIQNITPEFNTFEVPVDSVFSIFFNKPVTIYADDVGFKFECLKQSGIPVVATGDPYTFSNVHQFSPAVPLPPGDFCTLVIPYSAITDENGELPLYDFTSQVFTAGCGGIATPIHKLREGVVTMGEYFVVEGVVTAQTPELGGYFLQSDAPDANLATTEGIFVYDPGRNVTLNDKIRLFGKLQEYNSPAGSLGQHYHQKELMVEAGMVECATGISIEPTILDLPLTAGTLEAYEGMLVTIPETLTVQQNYFLGRFGQVTLAADGRVFNPNNGQGGTLDDAVAKMIVLDDGSHVQNPSAVPYYAADGALRAGDTVNGLTGVLDHGRITAARSDAPEFTGAFPYVYYRLHPTIPPVFTSANPRPAGSLAPEVGGELQVASFNVHNFFTTLDDKPYPETSPYDSTNTPRGADSANELQRQTDKLVSSLSALDADVIGLVELEAWQGAGAADALAAALNSRVGAGTYAAIPDPAGFPYPQKLPEVGGDFIKTALIYNTTSVTPIGPPMMDDNLIYSRVPVSQTFQAKADGEVFSVVVNHFKSRGDCPTEISDPNLDTGQGCWNALRLQQAGQLLTFVGDIQTTSGDPDVLVIGDLNAYSAEDPVTVLTTGGLTNLVSSFLPASQQYSYIFDGQSGYLDHALATDSLGFQTAGAAFWHINADEPPIIDYNTEFNPAGLYAAHSYRSSDHDPLIVGLNLYTPRTTISSDDLPAAFRVDQLVEFHLRAQNPAGSDPVSLAIFHYRISNTAKADIDAFEYFADGTGWLSMPVVQDGADVTGSFGPPDGFLMPAGYDITTAFRIRFNRPGRHTVTVTLDDLALEPPVTRAVFSREVTVQTMIYLPIIGR